MENQYIVIATNADGVVSMHTYTKEQILNMVPIWDKWNIPINVGDQNTDLVADNQLYIIKGKFVKPMPITQITEWDIA